MSAPSAIRIDAEATASDSLPVSARIPEHAAAVLEALAFRDADVSRIEALDESGWKSALAFCDKNQLTLLLGHYRGYALPEWVDARIQANSVSQSRRLEHLKAALFELTDAFDALQIDYALLKGLSHSPDFTPNPLLRAQADCDLWFQPKDVYTARDVLTRLGYVPICKHNRRHLAPMARPSSWKWDGDYFSPDIPIAVDLHFQLWDEEVESFPIPGEEAFWNRRRLLTVGNRQLCALDLADTLAFAAIHSLMHLLQGDVRLQRVWEIGNFLNRRLTDDPFWLAWRRDHDVQLRIIQCIVFTLAARWFRCGLHPIVQEEITLLPDEVRFWIEFYSSSPLEALFRPNKDELWLHLSLIQVSSRKLRVSLRRLIPLRLPNSLQPASSRPNSYVTSSHQVKHLIGRCVFHARVIGPALLAGTRWLWRRQELNPAYLRYLSASAFFDLGMMVFVLLYNLYLLNLGLHERVIGQVAGALTAGTLVGAVPAAWLIRRVGLRAALLTAIIGVSAASALRVVATGTSGLLVTSLIHGLFLSLWTVSFSPAIAGLSNLKNRAFAFSLVFALGMGLGIPGGILGGRLPDMLIHLGLAGNPLAAERLVLLIASGFTLLAFAPMLTVRFQQPPMETEKKVYPRSRFFVGFLIWLAVWSTATAAFNPFFSAYLSQLHFSVSQIGTLFSWSQAFQVVAVLLMPVILRKWSERKGIAATQLATGVMFALLAAAFAGLPVAALYVGCMSFQYMTGPSVYGMLMTRVSVGERSGASALNFVVSSLFGILASVSAGSVITRFGYPVLLISCSILSATAAALFLLVLRFHKPFTSSEPISEAVSLE